MQNTHVLIENAATERVRESEATRICSSVTQSVVTEKSLTFLIIIEFENTNTDILTRIRYYPPCRLGVQYIQNRYYPDQLDETPAG